MRRDCDCQEFIDFTEAFGREVSDNLLQEACKAFYGSRERGRTGRVDRHSKESHDREGNNHTFKGTIDHGARCWYFEIEDGNNNGTVVLTWERQWKYGGYPPPAQSAWMFMPVKNIAFRFTIDRSTELLLTEFEKLKARTSC